MVIWKKKRIVVYILLILLMFASNAARSFAFISAACLFCVGCHRCPTPDGVSMCFLSAARACVLPQRGLRQRVPQCPENRHIFRPRREMMSAWRAAWEQLIVNNLQTSEGPRCRGAQWAQSRPLWPEGWLPVWQLEFESCRLWQINPRSWVGAQVKVYFSHFVASCQRVWISFCFDVHKQLYCCETSSRVFCYSSRDYLSFPIWDDKIFLLFHLFSLSITWPKLSFVLVSGTFQQQLWKYKGLFLLSG